MERRIEQAPVIEQAPAPSELSKVRGRRGRILVGTLALGAISLITLGSGIAVANGGSSDDSGNDTAIVECHSGTVTDGDIQMSAASATKVSRVELPDLPGGCSVTPS